MATTAKPISGVLLVDKPVDWTSHDVVAKLRTVLKQKQIGHTGTLDPFATGLLLIAVGTATRLIEYTHSWPKTYEAEFTLGARSDTDDLTGTITTNTCEKPMHDQVKQALASFEGPLQQIPPIYSAVKKEGSKLYEISRAGNTTEALAIAKKAARNITIHSIELSHYTYPVGEIAVRCSTGTYIRALVRDAGNKLNNCGAYTSKLRRTTIGPFSLSTGLPVVKLPTLFHETTPGNYLLPASTLVQHLPRLDLNEEDVAKCEKGQEIEVPSSSIKHANVSPDSPITLYKKNSDQLVGIGTINPTTHLLHADKILV